MASIKTAWFAGKHGGDVTVRWPARGNPATDVDLNFALTSWVESIHSTLFSVDLCSTVFRHHSLQLFCLSSQQLQLPESEHRQGNDILRVRERQSLPTPKLLENSNDPSPERERCRKQTQTVFEEDERG